MTYNKYTSYFDADDHDRSHLSHSIFGESL